ncbi:MAG: hypothetical protein KBC11_02940 [Candidatus Pacebacteria bacterium]|nr:hypothetical protein [Candidatus Paceibacterota bacterium]
MSFLDDKRRESFGLKDSRTNSSSVIEETVDRSKKAKKVSEKKKNETDGIDALDEIEEDDRLREGFELLRGEDY